MPEKILFELVSPARLLFSEPVEMVVVPGTEGDFGALARHAPMIATVRPGVIDVHENGKVTKRIFVAGGFAEVTEERITVLAEEAIPVGELSKEKAAERKAEAKSAIEDAKSERDLHLAQSRMAVAEAMEAAAP